MRYRLKSVCTIFFAFGVHLRYNEHNHCVKTKEITMDSIRMSAPCLFGIEGVLADELRRMGASEVTPDTGKVLFSGDDL